MRSQLALSAAVQRASKSSRKTGQRQQQHALPSLSLALLMPAGVKPPGVMPVAADMEIIVVVAAALDVFRVSFFSWHWVW